jgi:hypothetical protein
LPATEPMSQAAADASATGSDAPVAAMETKTPDVARPAPAALAANAQPLVPAPAGPQCASCCKSHSCHPKCQRFLEWLTYRPLERAGCCCHLKPACCTPPLYTFFPCPTCASGAPSVPTKPIVPPTTAAPANPPAPSPAASNKAAMPAAHPTGEAAIVAQPDND